MEIKAFFNAIGMVGSNEAVPVLQQLLERKSWFGRAKSDEIHIGAANTLSAIGTPEARAILEEYGFNLQKDLTIANLSQSESVQALKDGVVVAVFFNFAYPGSAVMDLAATREILLIPIEPAVADQLVKKYPYYVKSNIPAKTYPKADYDVSVGPSVPSVSIPTTAVLR